jgi:peptidoglycan/LPS O-acetylase OafA/YrhL
LNLSTKTAAYYRADVDGLRAVAVLAVLAFHAFPDVLPGGFTGVDIFFVISGFLISRLILVDLALGSFSFADFYSRRIRRIFPALALVLITCVVIGWWVLLPAEFRRLGRHVAAGAGFVSNFMLYSEAGYFDTQAELKPLLHLWSLGVEEQYYLLWPLMLFAFRKHLHSILWLIGAVAVASFALNVIATTTHYQDAAFYFPVTRFWELMIGGLIAYVQVLGHGRTAVDPPADPSLRDHSMSLAGLVLVIVALVIIREGRNFPGWWALLPTSGAALLIGAGPRAFINRHLLSTRVAVFIGVISYPLYLWHWPLLTIARIMNNASLPPLSVRIGILLTSVLLAWLTYEFVERRIRHVSRGGRSRVVVSSLATTMAGLTAFGLLMFASIVQSRSAAVPHLAAISEAFDDWKNIPDEEIQGDSSRTALFMGDSHMAHFLPRIEKIAREHPDQAGTVIFRTRHGCAPIPGIERLGRHCNEFVEDGLRIARRKNVTVVVLSATWVGFTQRDDYYKVDDEGGTNRPINVLSDENRWVWEGFEREIGHLVGAGKQVVLVLESPRSHYEINPDKMVTRKGINFEVTIAPAVPRDVIVAENEFVNKRLRDIATRTGATIVDPLDALCTTRACPGLDRDGNPIYKDGAHIRMSFVEAHFNLLDRFVLLDQAHGLRPQGR